MGINKGPEFAKRDIYVDYPFEDVMFRWDHQRELIFRKFYGEKESPEPIPHDNRLFNEALLDGVEISQEVYYGQTVSATPTEIHAVPAPGVCPQAGFWHSPAQIGSRRFFSYGDSMPRLESSYGGTIWQWDINQNPDKS